MERLSFKLEGLRTSSNSHNQICMKRFARRNQHNESVHDGICVMGSAWWNPHNRMVCTIQSASWNSHNRMRNRITHCGAWTWLASWVFFFRDFVAYYFRWERRTAASKRARAESDHVFIGQKVKNSDQISVRNSQRNTVAVGQKFGIPRSGIWSRENARALERRNSVTGM